MERNAGDLRAAHFVGMHALQVLPLLAHHLLRTERAVLLCTGLYGALAVLLLVLALNGTPIVRPGGAAGAPPGPSGNTAG